MVKRALVLLLTALVTTSSSAFAQSVEAQDGFFSVKVTLGGSTLPSTTSVRMLGLVAKSSETECLWVNTSTGDIAKGSCGTVTSVSFTDSTGLFSVAGSPVTGTGGFTLTYASQSANTVLARSTGAGVPSFQSLTKAMQFSSTVYTDQANTWGAFLQSMGGGLTVSSGTTTTQALSSTAGTFTGTVAANAGITVDTTAFTVADTTGNVSTTGTLAVTSTADLKGNISDSTGNLTLNDNVDVFDNLVLGSATGEYVRSGSYASRTTGWQIDYDGTADLREGFFDQMKVKLFTVEQTQAVNGSMQWTKSVAELAGETTVGGAVTCPTLGAAETYWFRDFPNAANIRVFQANDYVSIRTLAWSDSGADGAAELAVTDCVGVVTAYADGTAGNDGYQSWTFTRPSGANGGSMAGGTAIALKLPALNYGVTADGVLDATVNDGTNNVNAPYFGVKKWTTSPIAANFTNLARFGQLRGITSVDEYGIFAGPSFGATNGQYFRASDVNFDLNGIDVKFWSGATNVMRLNPNAGDPYFALGATLPTSIDTNSGIWLGEVGGVTQARFGDPAGNRIRWDGTNLKIVSQHLTIDENGVVITPTTSFTNTRAYSFKGTAGGADFGVQGSEGANTQYINIEAAPTVGLYHGAVRLRATNATTGTGSEVFVEAQGGGGGGGRLYLTGESEVDLLTDLGTAAASLNATGFTVNGSLTVDTSTLFVDATANELGVGTTTPSAKFAVEAGDIVIDPDKKIYLHGDAAGTLDTNWYLYKDNTNHNVHIGGYGSTTRSFIVEDTAASNAQRFSVNFASGLTTITVPASSTMSQGMYLLNPYATTNVWTGAYLSFGYSAGENYSARIYGQHNAFSSYASRLYFQTHATGTGTWNTASYINENGDFIFGKGMIVTGAATLGASAWAGTFSAESSSTFRQYTGDGSGWKWALAQRGSSTTTDLVWLTDNDDNLNVLQNVYAAGFRIAATAAVGTTTPCLGGTTNAFLGTCTSSRRYKQDIVPFGGNRAILQVQPKLFRLKTNPTGPREVGAIAEEVDALGLKYLVRYDADGRPDGLNYDKMALYLIPIIKQQQQQIEALTKRLEALESRSKEPR